MSRTTHINIIAKNSLGSLERILRLVRHRGFEVSYFQANSYDIEDGLAITMQVTSERQESNLFYQLYKLVDVVEVNLNNQQKVRSCLSNG